MTADELLKQLVACHVCQALVFRAKFEEHRAWHHKMIDMVSATIDLAAEPPPSRWRFPFTFG